MGSVKQKCTFECAQNVHIQIILSMGLCSQFIHSLVSNDSVNGQ